MKRYLIPILICLFVISLSSCRLFKGKNKCGTCPSWKADVQQIDTPQQAKV